MSKMRAAGFSLRGCLKVVSRWRGFVALRPAVIGLILPAVVSIQCRRASTGPDVSAQAGATAASQSVQHFESATEQERLAASDPLGFLKMCQERCLETVTDYRCLFKKRERLGGELSPDAEEIEIMFRENPFSVDMRWIKNPRRAARITYVAGRWVEDGRQLATIKPSGLLGLLAPAGVKRDIHGKEMTAESRRPVDMFGFRNTLDLVFKYCERAQGDPRYDLSYLGVEPVDGRPCYVFERRLPYTGEGGPYPDRLLVVHIDREWLVPTATFSYADDARELLLGSYQFADVHFNINLTDEDF